MIHDLSSNLPSGLGTILLSDIVPLRKDFVRRSSILPPPTQARPLFERSSVSLNGRYTRQTRQILSRKLVNRPFSMGGRTSVVGPRAKVGAFSPPCLPREAAQRATRKGSERYDILRCRAQDGVSNALHPSRNQVPLFNVRHQVVDTLPSANFGPTKRTRLERDDVCSIRYQQCI